MADQTIATCVVDHITDCADPGYYYCIEDAEGNQTDSIGPFDSTEQAEEAFMAAMTEAAKEMIKQTLGLED